MNFRRAVSIFGSKGFFLGPRGPDQARAERGRVMILLYCLLFLLLLFYCLLFLFFFLFFIFEKKRIKISRKTIIKSPSSKIFNYLSLGFFWRKSALGTSYWHARREGAEGRRSKKRGGGGEITAQT